jgi:hypothetical protein
MPVIAAWAGLPRVLAPGTLKTFRAAHCTAHRPMHGNVAMHLLTEGHACMHKMLPHAE